MDPVEIASVKIARSPDAFDYSEVMARFQYAKDALLCAQQQHCEAASEFLIVRTQVQQLLALVFPEPVHRTDAASE